MNKVIKVLIVDDSAYVRKVVREMLSHSPFIEVVGAARDGREALGMVEALKPDVVATDLMMPELDGLGFIQEQMGRVPVPILVMSSVGENSSDTLSALDAGAVDFVQKPTALAVEKMFEMREELIEKVKMAAAAHPTHPLPSAAPSPSSANGSGPSSSEHFDVVAVGVSTGGPQALRYVIPQLPADFPVPIVVVLHMPVGYTGMYAERLDAISDIEVREARVGDELRPGRLLLAPAGKHLHLKRLGSGKVVSQLNLRPEGMTHRPSVDVLFQSAADIFGSRTLGLVMTGMGSDGKAGAAWVKAKGGTIFTESEESCVVYGMPGSVVEAGLSDKVVPLERIPRTLIEAM